MPVEPEKFLSIAFELLGRDSEYAWRTSIGRSYYAAFGVVRERLALRNVTFANQGVHTAVYKHLMAHSDKDVRGAGAELKRVFEARKDADYELGKTVTSDDAEDARERAIDVIQVAKDHL